MKHFVFLSLSAVILSSASVRASECRRYADSVFHYSICAPGDWKKQYREDGDRHYLAFRRGRDAAEISFTALPAGGEDDPEVSDWKKLVRRGAGKGYRKIIETKELTAGGNVTVKIIVFDYYSRGMRMLQRTMLSRYGSNVLVIECRAPIRAFSKYTDLFNEVMSSVDYTGTLTGDAMDEPVEDKAVARERIKTEKPPVPRKKAEPKKPPVIVKKKEPETDSSLSKQGEEKEDLPIAKPEPVREDASAEKPREEKSDDSTVIRGEPAPAQKGGGEVIDVESIEDPEARKVIKEELDTLKDMERRGLIEKVE